jgi:hypothetical protein
VFSLSLKLTKKIMSLIQKNKDTLTSTNFNKLILGELGSGSKSIIFKQNEFKKELAPINARIEYGEINGEKIVTMTYRV